MSKFKQGLKFRHTNALDTDIMIVTEDREDMDSVTLTVMFMSQTSGRPIHRQQITIKAQDFDNWKQIVEDKR